MKVQSSSMSVLCLVYWASYVISAVPISQEPGPDQGPNAEEIYAG